MQIGSQSIALDISFLCLSTEGASFKLAALTKTAVPEPYSGMAAKQGKDKIFFFH